MNKRIKKILKITLLFIVLLFAFAIWYLLNETKDEVNTDFSKIEKDIKSVYNPKRMGGFSVSVFSADSIYYMKGFGYSDVSKKKEYSSLTQQYIASISKTLIGFSLLKAEELGYLEINNSINEYLPFKIINPKFNDVPITLKHLATHTSSLDYNEEVVESLYIVDSLKTSSLEPIMRDYFEKGIFGEVKYGNYKPGSEFNYSNIGASLVAYIIELSSGLTFDQFTAKYIFKPLEMQNSNWFEKQSDSALLSSYYENNEGTIQKVKTEGVKMYPSRDLITDIKDLTTFCQAIIRRDSKLLNSDSFEKLLNPQLDADVVNDVIDNSGLFFMIDRNQFGVTYPLTGMNGGDNCINTMMWFDPVTKLGYIFIGNTGQSEKNRVNHIWLFRTLVSLGDYIVFNDQKTSSVQKLKYKWHNWHSRVNGIF